MFYEYTLRTDKEGFYDITASVRKSLEASGITDGVAVVYCPHTTAGITINENADHDVKNDLLYAMDKIFPDMQEFRHMEGNSKAHLKALVTGSSVTVIINDKRLVLGTWQGIYFTEYDGPRNRKFQVKII